MSSSIVIPLGLLLALAMKAGPVQDEQSGPWRTWGAGDGLAEAFVRTIVIGPDGRVALKHGRVDQLDFLGLFPAADGAIVIHTTVPDALWSFRPGTGRLTPVVIPPGLDFRRMLARDIRSVWIFRPSRAVTAAVCYSSVSLTP
jgi:hypothetical protein